MAPKRCIIMSGIPGSGKSTFVQNKLPSIGTVLSADQFWMVGGEYKFDPARIGDAHNWCYRRFIETLLGGRELVIVDNTNLRVFEVAPYYRAAEVFDYEVTIIRLLCDPKRAVERQIHGVPMDQLTKMANSFEPLPSWWNIEYVMT